MTPGPDLPLELIPVILGHLPKAHYLTQAALVNHAFYQSTIPLLYVRASIYSWHIEAKRRAIQLFRTLSSSPQLARYIRRLEIRDFPKNSLPKNLLELISKGLQNCINLHSCTWTRDGSLTSDILLALSNPSPNSSGILSTPSSLAPVHQLRELEINGHHSNLYDPKLLLNFRWLERISVIMPTVGVVQVLEEWVKIVRDSLRSLNVVCKASTVITDDVLIRMASSLRNLEFFHLTGCRRVTHKGIHAVLIESKKGIQNLGLEGVSSRLDLAQLLPTSVSQPPTFHNLHSLTLSIPHLDPISLPTLALITPDHGYNYLQMAALLDVHQYSNTSQPPSTSPTLETHISTLLDILTHHTPNLQKIQIYSPYVLFDPFQAMSGLFSGLVERHGKRLKRISLHRMLIDSDVIGEICTNCPVMEELFVVVKPGELDTLADHVHYAKSLKTIHVNYPLGARSEGHDGPVLSLDEALRFVRRCDNPSITQFGCNSRVWLVNRRVVVREDRDGDEKMECEIVLGPYESPDIPEQFMVVRT